MAIEFETRLPVSLMAAHREVSHHHHTSSHSSSSRGGKSGRVRLPAGFAPESNSVICGRGKACTTALGNRRLRAIVEHHLTAYSEAKTKVEKSNIVSKIMETTMNGKTQGCFVRYEDGSWWEVDEGAAREKIGSLLRDCLHHQYRSSTKAKLARRRKAQKLLKEQNSSSTSCPTPLFSFDPTSLSTTNGLSSMFDQRNNSMMNNEQQPVLTMNQSFTSSNLHNNAVQQPDALLSSCFQQQLLQPSDINVTTITTNSNSSSSPSRIRGLRDIFSFLPDYLSQQQQQPQQQGGVLSLQNQNDNNTNLDLNNGSPSSSALGHLSAVRQAYDLVQDSAAVAAAASSSGMNILQQGAGGDDDLPDDLSDIFDD